MTTGASHEADWQAQAACAGEDTERWYAANPSQAVKVCAGCDVRIECLYDALQREPPYHRFGVWGGLTATERRDLPVLTGTKPAVLAALRELLPAVVISDPPSAERPDPPVNTTPSPSPAAAPTSGIELVTISGLLRWAEEHPDRTVQDQGARAEEALSGLRKRYAADQELTALSTEEEQLEKRLAALRTRKAELVPAKSKPARKPVEYPAATVRAWAGENGIECPAVGRVPKPVVDAWRAATSGAAE